MGATTLDLFRSGNSTSANLNKVRTPSNHAFPDVDTYLDTNGAEWVKANGKGISTQDAPQPTYRGPAWRLVKGSLYPDSLRVDETDPGEWLWAPKDDMLLAEYEAALSLANASFVKV